MAVDCLDDLLLLGSVHADGPERLPGAAVRADEGLVVLPGKRRSAVVGPAAKRADRRPYDVILHSRIPPCIYRRRRSECSCRSKRCRTPPGRSSCKSWRGFRWGAPHA